AVGEPSVHETGASTPVLRVPLADHVDAGGVDDTGPESAQDGVEGHHHDQVAGVGDREVRDETQRRSDEHRSACADLTPFAQPSPRGRARPAGSAPPAWKNAHTLVIQNVSVVLQW